MREVETVYNSILHNLQTNPALRQTDIAVLGRSSTDSQRICLEFLERLAARGAGEGGPENRLGLTRPQAPRSE